MGRKKTSRRHSGQYFECASDFDTFESAKKAEQQRKNEKKRKAKHRRIDGKRDQKDAIEHGLENRNTGAVSCQGDGCDDHETAPGEVETPEAEDPVAEYRNQESEPKRFSECAESSEQLLESDLLHSDSDVIGHFTESFTSNLDEQSVESVLQAEMDEVSLLAFEEDLKSPLSLSLEELQSIQDSVLPNSDAQVVPVNWTHRGYSRLEPNELARESSLLMSAESLTESNTEDQDSSQLPASTADSNNHFANPVKTLTVREIMRLDAEESDTGTDTSSVVGRFKFDGNTDDEDDDDDYQENSGQTIKDIPYVSRQCRDYHQVVQERYMAMSNKEKLEKIIRETAPKPEEISKMDQAGQLYAIDQKRVELEVATFGDYTIGGTLDEIHKFDPTTLVFPETEIGSLSTTPLEAIAESARQVYGRKNVPNRLKKPKNQKPAKALAEKRNITSVQHHENRPNGKRQPGPHKSGNVAPQTNFNQQCFSKQPGPTSFQAPPRFQKANNNRSRKKPKSRKANAVPQNQYQQNYQPIQTHQQGQREFFYTGEEIQRAREYQQRQPPGRFDRNLKSHHFPTHLPSQQFGQQISQSNDQFRRQASQQYALPEQHQQHRFRLNPNAAAFCPDQIPSVSGHPPTAFFHYAGSVPQELLYPFVPASKSFMGQGAVGLQPFMESTSSDLQFSDPAIIGFVPLQPTHAPQHHVLPEHHQSPANIWVNNTGFAENRSIYPTEQIQGYHHSVQHEGPVVWDEPPSLDMASIDELIQTGLSQQMLPPWWDVSKSDDLPAEYVESMNALRNLDF